MLCGSRSGRRRLHSPRPVPSGPLPKVSIARSEQCECGVKSCQRLTVAPPDAASLYVDIPKCLASGEYLLRVEHLGLHAASAVGGAQFYVACAQINVSGGGSKTVSGSSLVSFPGAYSPNDPGILFQLYWPIPTSYQNPGPAAISC